MKPNKTHHTADSADRSGPRNSRAQLPHPEYRPPAGNWGGLELTYPDRLVAPPAWLDHIPFAFWIVAALRPRTLVELGVHSGNSYCAFLQAVQSLGLTTRCFGIDHWRGDDQAGAYGEEVYADLEAYHRPRYGAFSTLIRSTFQEALPYFSNETIDLLHIDGHHTYESVHEDFASWLPKMSGRGVVLLHDTNVRERGFGVWKLWQEVASRYPHFEFVHGSGLGAAYVGREPMPEPFEALLGAGSEAAIHAYFVRLGASILDRLAMNEANGELRSLRATLTRQIGEYSNRVAALEAELQTVRKAQARFEHRAAESERALEARSAEVTSRDAALASAASREADLERALEARSAEVTTAQSQAAALEHRLAVESAAATREASELRSTLEARARELQSIRTSISWRLTAFLRRFARRLPWLARPMRAAFRLLWWTATFQLASRLRLQRRLRSDAQLIVSSGLFNRDWYYQAYPDVRQSGADAARHYVEYGAAEGRYPNPLFGSEWYLDQYPDVRAVGANPLVHYLRHGAAEGRNASPFFDNNWYLEQNPDVAAAGLNPLAHYLQFGAFEGRDPQPLFDIDWYLSQCPDIAGTGMTPLEHYVTVGASKRRDPGPFFSGRSYLAQHPDAVGMNPLAHFNESLRREPRERAEYYQLWIRRFDSLTEDDRKVFCDALEKFARRPLISVLMPVYETGVYWLERAIESVRNQIYPNWQLCISDDASTDPRVRQVLDKYARLDSRISIFYRETRGHISANSNTALGLATGEYVALLDADDELSEHALFWIVHEILRHPSAEVIYSDEDKLDANGNRFGPYFKPDWNPALMLSQNVCCHLGVFKRSLLEKIGGFRPGFEGSQDHDLILRCAEIAGPQRIRHIPRVLYHWRAIPGSSGSQAGLSAKPYAWQAGKRAIEEHLNRCRTPGVVQLAAGQYYQVEYQLVPPHPKVSIIIPTALTRNLVITCIESLLHRSSYPNFEVLIAANGICFKSPDQKRVLSSLTSDPRVKVLVYEDQPFNFSKINNWAVRQSDGSLLCLMNDDVEVITEDWLEKLVARAQLPTVGAVGAMLLYPDKTIQHAGVILGLGGVAGHPFRRLSRGTGGYFGRAALEQDLSCVTAACMMVRREVFDLVNGFNEKLIIAFNDVDLCIRIRNAGWRIIWTPTVELFHHESVSVGQPSSEQRKQQFEFECQFMRELWGETLNNDPFYNSNLSLATNYFGLSFPPRIATLPEFAPARASKLLAS
jgi:GT2 family glycosyltransferase